MGENGNVDQRLNRENFEIRSEADVVRVDGLCRELLLRFYNRLLETGVPPEEATVLASGADYYARDFVVDARMTSVFREDPRLIRQFGGTWYIISNAEPNLVELSAQLAGVRAFYAFLHELGGVSAGFLEEVETAAADIGWYEERIASFWAITGEGYKEWEALCTLGKTPR